MLVYVANKREFLNDCDFKDIECVIEERFKEKSGKSVGHSERVSWRNSLVAMAKVLRDEKISPDAGVAVELHLPQSSKRIDVSLSGYGPDGHRNIVLIELKQWEKVSKTAKDGIIKTFVGGANREVVHPAYQAWSYCAFLEGFSEPVYNDEISVSPCAYLHNYVRDGVIDDERYGDYISRSPIFCRGEDEREKLRAFITKYISSGDNKDAFYRLDSGRIRPSKALSDSLAGLLRSNDEFILIDGQKEIFESVRSAAMAATEQSPRVLIIEGGPGTGKSVIAINLLVKLIGAGLLGRYVSKNSAPREVYKEKLTGVVSKAKFASLFSGSGSFVDSPKAIFDFLVIDEAHRLNEKSGLYGNLGENQIKEVINSSNCAIFFLDEDQRVTLKDIGSKEVISAYANARGATVEEYRLESQFRCSGSDGYIAWLDRVLGIRETVSDQVSLEKYDFRVFDDPEDLHSEIARLNDNNRARVVAGYCWPWSSKKDPNSSDLVIGGYKRKWNLGSDGSLWIISPTSVEQVGCIHTCQGLEVDYIGVIIGPDLIVRDGVVLTDPNKRDRHDKTVRGHKSMSKLDPVATHELTDRIIKNTYRTLMTRGMKGCFIYATDSETSDYFKSLLKSSGLTSSTST